MPERTCLGCRAVKEKASLLRLVCMDGALAVDGKGVMPGRGAYICPEKKCLVEALRKNAVPRALKTKVLLPELEPLWATIAGFK